MSAETTAVTAEPVLTARGVSRSFGAVRALAGVDLDVHAGEVHAICGENGAGKSTLMAILAGSLRPDSGELHLDGRRYAPASAAQGAAAGIAIVYQERSLLPDVSVAENICALTEHAGGGFLLQRRRMRQTARELLSGFDPSIDPERPAGRYTVAQQQVIEIAKAEARRPRILILDEPTASIGAEAKDQLFTIIRQLRGRGLAVVYISHHLDEVFQVADRVTVLRNGERAGMWRVAETDERRLAAAMTGRSLRGELEPGQAGAAERERAERPLLEVAGLARTGEFTGISFEVYPGEIVALAGLVGAGRTEVGETVSGIRRAEAGSVRFDGRPLPAGDPAAAIARGVCMMTEDRKDSGLFLDMTIRANIAAPSLARLRRGPLVNDRSSRDLALHYMRRLQIRAPSAETPVSRLSGGNQQKVLIAMWLATDPRVLIADEPTKGVDVGAKDEIHHILAALREEGAGVLLISSDPRETRRLADRVLVMRKGRIVAELPGDVTEGEIVAYASGASGGTAA